ncbi:MAG: ATP-binding cassette domain-containing protein, partial [Rhodospirillaceae bacterium]|nr:ATP-binding cassette domain-containing protein [Rhodospirillaceae bacterium]
MSTKDPSKPEIRIRGLKKVFESNRVLNLIDLDINKGEIVAIVGGSGCGKTVLLNHILGQLKPDGGQVLAANHETDAAPLVDMAKVDEHELGLIHTHWGVVFQKNALFSGSVMDNMALWLDEIKNLNADEIKPIATSALESVGLPITDDFLSLPVSDLSGGMAKRLAVARAIAMSPNVIFYDEPTTGLDPASAMQIQDLIVATHSDKRTTVIITHDKDLLKRLKPRIIMLHGGYVYFDGTLDEFEKSSS